MMKTTRTLVAAAAMAMLAACGGGSDSDVNVNTPPTTDVPSAQDSSVTDAIQSSTYAVGSEELAAFNRLNAERRQCGFGTLRQDTRLDQAARAHADWMLINNVYSHTESAQYPNGLTGVNPWDRTTLAGYPATYSTSELIAFGSSGTKDGRGEKGVRELLSGVYHGIGALRPMKDVGISVRAPSEVGATTLIVPTEIVTGTTNGYQLIAQDAVLTYPCEGVNGTEYQLTDEDPNPVPDRNLGASPLGHPIIVMARVGQTLDISSASMRRVSDGASITLRTPVTGSSDPNGRLANDPQIGYVLPDAPLQPSTTYRVEISGTNNGVPFLKAFTFSTGN